MQLSSEQLIPVSQQITWDALNDTAMLKDCIAGCESITPAGENEYDVALTAAIGPVKAKFKGKLRLSDIQPPTSYVIHFEGQGGAAGHGKGSAEVKLEAVSANETRLAYTANAQVGGKIAQIGSRLVDMAAQKMAGDFFASFNAKLAALHPAAAEAVAPTPVPVAEPAAESGGFFAKIAAFFRNLFG